jgi:hypothetical protein
MTAIVEEVTEDFDLRDLLEQQALILTFPLADVPAPIPAYCYEHALSDPFRFLSGRLRPIPVTAFFTAVTSQPTSCCVRLVPLTHNPWGFRNEGLLSIPQIKHMTYATMLLSYCSYCLLLYLLSLTYFFPH